VIAIAMRVDELDYHLPPELIAQRPLSERDASRMMLLERVGGHWSDHFFSELPELLRGDELLVLNNVRVLPARLFGHRAGVRSQKPSRKTAREHLTGTVEVLLTKQVGLDVWETLVRPGRKMHIGERVTFGAGEFEGEIIARGELGLRTIRFHSNNGESVQANIQRVGHVPLPPYIDRPDEEADKERYQTVFARESRAVAAPTAGLHFTAETFQKIQGRGCDTCEITLEVGLGTFQPIHAENLEDHKIHSEAYEIGEQAAQKINAAKREGRPVLAVGTTVVRTLEDAAGRAASSGEESNEPAGSRRYQGCRSIAPVRGEAELFIVPGYRFRIVDALLTNFHLPKSTLLALVSAFAGKESVLAAYRHAVEARYRFYSYGDCMLIR
jgi:S-adenosylmethionine:tRNA ribosyltransferase-isomerase